MIRLAVLALVMASAAGQQDSPGHPPIEHPPDLPISADVEQSLYRAAEAEHLVVVGIEITVGNAFGMNLPLVMMYGPAKASSPGLCRGPVFLFEEREDPQSGWKRASLDFSYAVRSPGCAGAVKPSSRIVLTASVADRDLIGIVDAVRQRRIAQSGDPMPTYDKSARIASLRISKDEALVSLVSGNGETRMVLLGRIAGKWFVVSAADEIGLPDEE